MKTIEIQSSLSPHENIRASLELFITNKGSIFLFLPILIIILSLLLVNIFLFVISVVLFTIIFSSIIYLSIEAKAVNVIFFEQRKNIIIKITQDGIELDNSINRIIFSWNSIYKIQFTQSYFWLLFWNNNLNFFIKKPIDIEPEILSGYLVKLKKGGG